MASSEVQAAGLQEPGKELSIFTLCSNPMT